MFEAFFILRSERGIIKNEHTSACNVLVILVGFLRNLNSIYRFSKNTEKTFMKIRPVVAKLLLMERRTGRRTDRYDHANSCVSKFCERA